MIQWFAYGDRRTYPYSLSFIFDKGSGLHEFTDVETFGNRRLRGWASRTARGDLFLKCREVGVDQTLHFVVPVGTSRNDSLEHIGSFQLQQGLSYFLLLLIRKGIVVYYGAVGFADIFKTYTLGQRAPGWGLRFVFVFVVRVHIRFYLRLVIRGFGQRTILVVGIVALAFGRNSENFVQFLRRDLPGVFLYTSGDKYIIFFTAFRASRTYGSGWRRLATLRQSPAMGIHVSNSCCGAVPGPEAVRRSFFESVARA